MRATIDKAGRVVIPRPLREALGLVPGPVDITADGNGLRIEPVQVATLVERDGHLVLPEAPEGAVTVQSVRELRLADQR